ncbi:ribose-phosphate diphosphokinase [Wolbachia endosymbiont of Diaphorina citri]|jgi:ribose-phosphate pyrophosphokinase|uniref:ribose-phosphate diphosphokinase n=1 Tax=Wolbachia endosymbiont of Diaphorina citri TaxID=116598 RepID=UPI0002DDAB4A|nr:ribose-phosphate diphosphokinase [Wolbachia endosymbiont of Diaphorina citri]QJT94022.1 ribose-phosphate diphosphokinase [Wolbachia endosymbiont of Diaphorina citri]QJT95263.1 ribose-phosphate diphosphokinase [Wolbachia endosymbiont of Diaphorina citri]QJT96509.1 ribose-phosphate diphosphokinase [Wolbachia endosymbiont of Diaphorina citri]QLK10918.1 ribose-phosphate diphosphokinase [Wolbachia endosymbiont of Diaphorina citri]QXY86588.1 ribose-phosphate diphosphokinase [Wolbachia endosymbion
MKVIIGSASKRLGDSIASGLNAQLLPTQVSRFADGEVNVEVANNLHNQEVYVVQSLSSPVNDNLMELLLTIDAAKRSGAKRITAIIPYYGYSRQDRVIKNNNMQSALSAKLVANLIQTAGANSVAAIDLHSSQIEGFFDIPVTNLSCFEVFVNSIYKENLAIVAPDVGAIGRARAFAKILEEKHKLDNTIIIVDKYREKAGTSQVMNVIGEVANKNCVIVDDIVDSGGTLCNAALALKDRGAKSVVSCITHGILSGNAVEKISSSSLDKLVITDTIFHKFEKNDKIEVVSIANILICFMQGGKSAS